MKRCALVLFAAFALAACHEGPTQADLDGSSPLFEIKDAVHSGGNEHFFFLPPMVSNPITSGTFDGSVEPVVEICQLSLCGTSTIASFTTTTGPGSETVRVNTLDEYYIVNWSTTDGVLGKTYRIQVSVNGTELGHADVILVSGGSMKNAKTQDVIPLKYGRTVPIKFRIEEGALGMRVDPAGGTITLAAGAVTLVLPAGAVSEPTFITAIPATDLPPEPLPISGTAFDFGPDGLVFDEPVTLTIQYDPTLLPPGIVEAELRLHELVDGQYAQVDAGAVDLDAKTVSGQIHGFSVFVLLERLFPGSPEDLTDPVAVALELFDQAPQCCGAARSSQPRRRELTLAKSTHNSILYS